MDDNAKIKYRGFEIPLIGIPKDATMEKCEMCGAMVNLVDIVFDSGEQICKKCLYPIITGNT